MALSKTVIITSPFPGDTLSFEWELSQRVVFSSRLASSGNFLIQVLLLNKEY